MSELDLILNDINKKFNSSIASVGPRCYVLEKVPFTSPRLNYMLYGGLPVGRLVEFSGDEGGGKTTTALDTVGQFQKHFPERRVVYVDCENTLDTAWATKLGVDINNLVIIQPDNQTAEQIFEMSLKLIDSGEVSLLVLDSLGVMLSALAYAKTVEEKTYGGIAQALTVFSKKATTSCTRNHCTVIGINQMRDDMNSMYGGSTTTGGRAWRHNCSVRLQFRKGSYIDENGKELSRACENPAGNIVQCSILKTKVCLANRKIGFYTLNYLEGIDFVSDTIDVAIKESLVLATGAWYSLVDPETGEVLVDEGNKLKFQGKARLKDYLSTNEDAWLNLKNALIKKFL